MAAPGDTARAGPGDPSGEGAPSAGPGGAIRPAECLLEGWRLVRGRYWFYVGIVTAGLLVGSLAPLGLLLGPMVCGVYAVLLREMRGEAAGAAALFSGFEHFVPSFVATLVQVVPIMGMAIPVNLLLALLFVKRLLVWLGPEYRLVAELLGPTEIALIVAVATAVLFAFSVLFGTLFMFSYPLIVDRGMSGWAAVKLSAAESRRHFAGAAGLMAATTLASVAGALVCYVGAFLVTPVTLAAWAVAYRKLFPERA